MEPEVHILVVDDDAQIRQLTARFLRENGYRVSGARDGREMRETLASADIDLIVLDLMLPGTSGLDLCRELRATSSIPMVMLSGPLLSPGWNTVLPPRTVASLCRVQRAPDRAGMTFRHGL